MEECKTLCRKHSQCVAFEYGVAYGGGGRYKSQDCQLQSGSDHTGCNGGYHNLDLYIVSHCSNGKGESTIGENYL